MLLMKITRDDHSHSSLISFIGEGNVLVPAASHGWLRLKCIELICTLQLDLAALNGNIICSHRSK